MDRLATYDFLLVVHSNYGSVSCRFRYEGRFWSKIANFPHLRVFNALANEIPLEFCNGGAVEITSMMPH